MKSKLDFLLKPWMVFLGMISGAIIGLNFKGLVPYIEPIGEIYLSLLQMSVIPILVSAVITSIGKLLKSKHASKYISKIIIVFVIFVLSVSVISIVIAAFYKNLVPVGMETQRAIGKLTISYSRDAGDSPGTVDRGQNNIISFLINIIPKNIFAALSQGENLKVIFFFIIMGVMLKYISDESSESILIIFDGIYNAFQKLIETIMYFLPFGLMALVASQLSQVGFAILGSLVKFIILIYISSFVIFLLSSIIVWKNSNQSLFKQFKDLSEPILICLGTRNSLAAVPSSINALSQEMNLNKERVNLTIPLGVSLGKYGNIMLFSLGAVFATQLYNITLGVDKILIIILTSSVAGIATAGVPGMVARPMIAMVLTPLGIPSEAIIAMILAIDSVIPVTTLIHLYPNLAATSIIAGDSSDVKREESSNLESVAVTHE